MKQCTSCKKEKEFNNDKNSKDKLSYWCHQCMADNYKKRGYNARYNQEYKKLEERLENEYNKPGFKEEVSRYITRLTNYGYLHLKDINKILWYYEVTYKTVKTPFDEKNMGSQLSYMYLKLKNDYYNDSTKN